MLWIGATSFGRGSSAYFRQELVKKRGWATEEEFIEAFALAKLIPGSTALNLLTYLVQGVRGWLAAIYCLVPYVLPGSAILLAVMLGLDHIPHSGTLNGALAGAALGGTGALLASTLQMIPAARKARHWIVFALAAFAATFVFRVNLLLVLGGLGSISVLSNHSKSY
jgi:chromate transporter